MANEKKRKRFSLPMTEETEARFSVLSEAMGPGITPTNVAVIATGIALPILESVYLGKEPPQALVGFPLTAEFPPGRGRPRADLPPGARRTISAPDEQLAPFPSVRAQATIAELGARAKLLGFKIVDNKHEPPNSPMDQAELDRLTAPAPKPAPTPPVPGPNAPPANVVDLAPPVDAALGSNDHPETQFDPDPGTEDGQPYIIPKEDLPTFADFEEEPDGDQKQDSVPLQSGTLLSTGPEIPVVHTPAGFSTDQPAPEPDQEVLTVTVEGQEVGFTNSKRDDNEEAERRDLVKEKLTELLEAGVPIEEAYEKARGATSDEGNGGSVTPLFAEEGTAVVDSFKCTHGVRFDAPEQCGACVEAGF